MKGGPNRWIEAAFFAVLSAILVVIVQKVLIPNKILDDYSRFYVYAGLLLFVGIYYVFSEFTGIRRYYALSLLGLVVLLVILVPTFERPVQVAEIWIPANDENGFRFTADQDGQYIFVYSQGAYSPLPEAATMDPVWRTRVTAFKDRAVVWVQRPLRPGDNPSINYLEPSQADADAYFGNYNVATRADSFKAAKHRSMRLRLQAGHYVTLVVSDDKGWYDGPDAGGPNLGGIYMTVFKSH
jgi:hypothetical protein